jgi:hypothetical protein
MYFINLKSKENNKEIYKIDLLLSTKVQFEASTSNEKSLSAKSKIWAHEKLLLTQPQMCQKCSRTFNRRMPMRINNVK